jgi:hypothetical protein
MAAVLNAAAEDRDAITSNISLPAAQRAIMREQLLPAVLRLYCDIERSGQSSQFYDKFNVRQSVSQLLRWMLTQEVHQMALGKLAKQALSQAGGKVDSSMAIGIAADDHHGDAAPRAVPDDASTSNPQLLLQLLNYALNDVLYLFDEMRSQLEVRPCLSAASLQHSAVLNPPCALSLPT